MGWAATATATASMGTRHAERKGVDAAVPADKWRQRFVGEVGRPWRGAYARKGAWANVAPAHTPRIVLWRERACTYASIEARAGAMRPPSGERCPDGTLLAHPVQEDGPETGLVSVSNGVADRVHEDEAGAVFALRSMRMPVSTAGLREGVEEGRCARPPMRPSALMGMSMERRLPSEGGAVVAGRSRRRRRGRQCRRLRVVCGRRNDSVGDLRTGRQTAGECEDEGGR